MLAFLPVLLVACNSDGCEPDAVDCGDPDGLPVEQAGEQSDPVTDSNTGAYSAADINHLVVVTGQSNVEASGTLYDPALDHPDPRVFAFTDDGWQVADLHQVWDDNAHPGNHSLTDPARSPNNNFVFHYGKSLAQIDDQAVVGFIVLAAPGQGIAHWDYESPFYLKMRNKINNALGQLPNKDKIDVMLWHQGESDGLYEGTSDPDATGFTDKSELEYVNYYAIKLDAVITNFRSETWGRSDLPFICGETRIGFEINRRLLALNEDDDASTYCVQTTDLPFLPSDPSGAHFSAVGLRELGRRYMQAYIDMANQ